MTASRHQSHFISRSKSALRSATALAVLLGVLPVQAEEGVLGTLIVQADRSPMQRDQIGRSLSVITGAQLETFKSPYIGDVLRKVPGLAVSGNGSVGALTQVRIRGGEANHTLVLIDGVPANDASDGDFNFGRLQVSEVERIEILRGPQGAFWGSNAISGVINIVTKPGIRSGMRTTLGSEIGSDGTRMGSALVQYGQDNFNWAGSVTARHTDGFKVDNAAQLRGAADHFDANLKFRADVSPALSLDGNLRYGDSTAAIDTQSTNGKPEAFGNRQRTKEFLGSLGGRWTSEDASWFQTARFSANKINSIWHSAGSDSLTQTNRYKASYQAGHVLYTPEFANAEHRFTFGYDLTYEDYNSPWAASITNRTTHGLAGEYRGAFNNQFYLTAALRHDFNDRFQDATTYSLSGAWQLPETGTRLHASLGTGASNPSFYEQFFHGDPKFVPNPNLKPEHSFAWDIGVEQKLFNDQLIVDVTYFNQRLEDLITTTDWTVSPSSVYNLPGISTRQGLELSATLDFLNGFTASASYTYTHARTAKDEIEIRRPAHLGVVNLAYRFEDVPLTLHASANFVGESKDSVFGMPGQQTLPAFTELGAGLNYQVSDKLELYGRVTNILDTANQTVYGYNTPGRAFYVGAKARF